MSTDTLSDDSSSVGEKTTKEIFDSFTDEQKNVVYFLIGEAVGDARKKALEHSLLLWSEKFDI